MAQMLPRQETVSRQTTVKKFSPGRALLSGGLMTSKAVTRVDSSSTEVREPFLLIRPRTPGPTLALYPGVLNFSFLGAQVAPSGASNLAATLSQLHALAPHASVEGQPAFRQPAGSDILPGRTSQTSTYECASSWPAKRFWAPRPTI